MGYAGENKGLYIHIPFCRAKCSYCDFNSYAGKEGLMDAYFKALRQEIHLYADTLSKENFGTIFIGGGTPSLADPRYIAGLLDSCFKSFSFVGGPEVTIEANPGTLSYEKLRLYRSAGINRLSLGLQAWQDTLLKELGRIHNLTEFLKNYDSAVKSGFDNINLDLIFGLPGQTLEDWIETVENTADLKPAHLSCYSLKIEEGTPFGDLLEKGQLKPAEDELDRSMYYHVIDRLAQKGYRHYEISNFSLPGFECRHNLVYWKAEEYLGIGAGAHSYMNSTRYNNVYGIEQYIDSMSKNKLPLENEEHISRTESMSEFMILGLRLTGGVDPSLFKTRYGESVDAVFGEAISQLITKKLLEKVNGRIRLTGMGLDLANKVFSEFI